MIPVVHSFDVMEYNFLIQKKKVLEDQLYLIGLLKTDVGFYNAVKCYVKKGNHPVVAFEKVNSFFKTLLGSLRFKSFDDFEQTIKKLGHEHPGDFYKV